MIDREVYDELCCYSLSKGDAEFMHQHIADAFAAQTVTEQDKPIKLTFALIGLYLYVEHGFTGREVQLAHMKLARKKREWPTLKLPEHRGNFPRDIMEITSESRRREMIDRWCKSTWRAFAGNREVLRKILEESHLISRIDRPHPQG